MVDPYLELMWEWDGYGPKDWNYIAPSWSWAAVSQVQYGSSTSQSHTFMAEIVDVKVVWSNQLSQFGQAGQVERGKLFIKSHLQRAWWSVPKNAEEKLWFDPDKQRILGKFYPDGRIQEVPESEWAPERVTDGESEGLSERESEWGSGGKSESLPETELEFEPKRLTAGLDSKLPVFVLLLGTKYYGEEMSVRGLVLKQLDSTTFSSLRIFSMEPRRLHRTERQGSATVEENLEEFIRNQKQTILIIWNFGCRCLHHQFNLEGALPKTSGRRMLCLIFSHEK